MLFKHNSTSYCNLYTGNPDRLLIYFSRPIGYGWLYRSRKNKCETSSEEVSQETRLLLDVIYDIKGIDTVWVRNNCVELYKLPDTYWFQFDVQLNNVFRLHFGNDLQETDSVDACVYNISWFRLAVVIIRRILRLGY